MPPLPIRLYGDPVLREKAQPITEITDELRHFAAAMIETMYEAGGVGLAANQVGDRRRILVLDVSERGEKGSAKRRRIPPAPEPEVYINPEVLESSVEDDDYSEGCLSIPGVEADVFRPRRLRLRWTDLEGQQHEQEIDGMRARVLQHEIDHLDGVLFIDHLPENRRKSLAGALARIRQSPPPDALD